MKNILRLLVASCALLSFTAAHAGDKPAKPAEPATAPAINVAGTWHCEVDTDQGKGTPSFTFTQDDSKLTGQYRGLFGEAPVTGSLKGAEITFSFKVSPQGQEFECTYTATVAGDTMKGKAKLGDFGEASFTGRRQPVMKK